MATNQYLCKNILITKSQQKTENNLLYRQV